MCVCVCVRGSIDATLNEIYSPKLSFLRPPLSLLLLLFLRSLTLHACGHWRSSIVAALVSTLIYVGVTLGWMPSSMSLDELATNALDSLRNDRAGDRSDSFFFPPFIHCSHTFIYLYIYVISIPWNRFFLVVGYLPLRSRLLPCSCSTLPFRHSLIGLEYCVCVFDRSNGPSFSLDSSPCLATSNSHPGSTHSYLLCHLRSNRERERKILFSYLSLKLTHTDNLSSSFCWLFSYPLLIFCQRKQLVEDVYIAQGLDL